MIVPGSANALMLGQPQGYNLTKSLRFRSSASANLTRTPASTGNRQKWTWSAWVKLGTISASNGTMFNAGTTSGETTSFYIRYTSDAWQVGTRNINYFTTSNLYRDPSAWYHVVCAYDSTQATASNRILFYVNGALATYTFGTNVTLNNNSAVNNTVQHDIGYDHIIPGGYFDGYMAEINFIDGQALTPSSFGSTNATTGVWQPARYTGTYGTNGFYLPFTNTTSTTTLGYDFSGNSNNWTTNNISLTTGSTYDSMTDVPTLTSATTANYCVLNPLVTPASTTIINGNLGLSGYTAYSSETGTIGVSSGKWYFEFIAQANSMSGITGTPNGSYYPGQASNAYAWDSSNTTKYNNNTGASYGAATSAGDIVGVAFDLDNGSITFYKNNVSQGTAYTFTPSGTYFPVVRNGSSTNTSVNFGQQGFTYTPPTGFVALNTYNLPTSTIVKGNKYMDATLYTGTGATQSIINAAGFYPDFLWIKSRNFSSYHALADSVRGASLLLNSNSTNAESTQSNSVTSFNSNGFSLGADTSTWVNYNTANLVAWQWQAGQGSTSSNTNGSITSTVSVNASAGFSVVTYTGAGTNSTIGHGLGVAPSMIITKSRSNAIDWQVYHASVGNGYYGVLDSTAAFASSGIWQNTSPTSSVFYAANYSGVNYSGYTYVAYCWAAIAGFSAFGSYTGNGSTDGTFIYTGFRPKFILFKCTSTTENWVIIDSSRDSYNVASDRLYPNTSGAEDTGAAVLDIVSNGFKQRNSAASGNISGQTYIYAAFAENPFKNALAR